MPIWFTNIANYYEDMRELNNSVKDLKATANRWRGAFWLMMGLAGSIGVISNLASGWMK